MKKSLGDEGSKNKNLYKIDVEQFKNLELTHSTLKIRKIEQGLSDWFIEFKTSINEILQKSRKLKSEEELEALKEQINKNHNSLLVDFKQLLEDKLARLKSNSKSLVS